MGEVTRHRKNDVLCACPECRKIKGIEVHVARFSDRAPDSFVYHLVQNIYSNGDYSFSYERARS